MILGIYLGRELFLELFARAAKHPVGSPQAHDVNISRGQLQKARKEKSQEGEDEKRDEACPLILRMICCVKWVLKLMCTLRRSKTVYR